MEKEANKGKDNILNSPNDESILDTGNDDIEVIPHWETAISEGIAVTYGPAPVINSFFSSIEEDDEAFPCVDGEILIDVDSDMYGGPLPVDFLLNETDLSVFTNEFELLCGNDNDSKDESGDRKYDDFDDFDDYHI